MSSQPFSPPPNPPSNWTPQPPTRPQTATGLQGMMLPRRRASNAAQKLVARVIALVLLLAIGAWIFFAFGHPAVTEVEVRNMVDTGELVGLTPKRAAERLQRPLPQPDMQGIIRVTFRDVSTWTSGPLELEVKDELITSATLPKLNPSPAK